jgi:hypothetical protein
MRKNNFFYNVILFKLAQLDQEDMSVENEN